MYEFTALDRCDGCGARAHHVARKPKCSDLLLCNHCWGKSHTKLYEEYWLIESDVSPAEPVPVAAYTE